MSVVGARNDTIIHGFVTDPDGRGTYSFFLGAALALSLSAPGRLYILMCQGSMVFGISYVERSGGRY